MKTKVRVKKPQKLVDALVKAIARGYKPQKIILFGSFARGDYHQGSDLDLIIIKNTRVRFLDRMEEVWNFCTEDMVVQPIVYTEKEIVQMLKGGNSFLETALVEGKVVYEKSE